MNESQDYVVTFPARDAFYQGLSINFYNEFQIFRDIFNAASNFLEEDLFEISYKNVAARPELHTVCLITHCYALYRVFTQYFPTPAAAAGFSQGEFTAAASTEAVLFPNVLRLVYELEQLLINNEVVKNGAMIRVMELDREKLRQCCDRVDPDGKFLSLGIYISKDQNVVSGEKNKIEELSKLAKESGARWVIPLGNGGAFHSPMCHSILGESKILFDKCSFFDTKSTLYLCSDGISTRNGQEIRDKLSKQIASPIFWDKVVSNLKQQGIRRMVELGPGCTVSGNTRIIDSGIECRWINNVKDLEGMLKTINEEDEYA